MRIKTSRLQLEVLNPHKDQLLIFYILHSVKVERRTYYTDKNLPKMASKQFAIAWSKSSSLQRSGLEKDNTLLLLVLMF